MTEYKDRCWQTQGLVLSRTLMVIDRCKACHECKPLLVKMDHVTEYGQHSQIIYLTNPRNRIPEISVT